MGYPVYKLLRAVNRQYPNNGFINYVDVREDMNNGIIDEDLRDLINETLQEIYTNIAIDEVYSFPTVPGQNQYALPEDCDLRDIQEVTRTFVGCRGPLKPPPGPGPEPGPSAQHVVTFTVDGDEGSIGTPPTPGTSVTEISREVPNGFTIGEYFTEEEITVFPLEGYDFIGWSLNGIIVSMEEILNTNVSEDLHYIGVFREEEEEEMRKLTDNIVLTNGVEPTLEEGFYYTGPYNVSVSGGTLPLFGNYSTFYYDAGTYTLTGPFSSATYSGDEWLLARDEMLATDVTNNDRIPVNSAVNKADGVATLTAYLSTDFTSTSESQEKIPLDNSTGYVGPEDRLALSSNDIIIGPGVQAVMVSATIDCEVDQINKGTTRYFYITQNNDTLAAISQTNTIASGSNTFQIVFTPFVITVNEGDRIKLETMCASSTSRKVLGNYNTWLTVQEIKVPTTRENPLG